jgi:hypothetical protein
VGAFDADGSKKDRRQPHARQRSVSQIGRQEGGRRQKAIYAIFDVDEIGDTCGRDAPLS